MTPSRVLVLAAAGFFLVFLALPGDRSPLAVDRAVFAWLVLPASSGAVPWVAALSRTGSVAGVLAACAVATLVLAWLRHRRLLLAVLVGGLGGGVLQELLKLAVPRQRPADALVHVASSSFPSGHALATAALYGVVFVLWRRCAPPRRKAFAWAALVLVTAVGATRLLLGVHWLSDVVAGWCAGAAWAAASLLLTGLASPRDGDG